MKSENPVVLEQSDFWICFESVWSCGSEMVSSHLKTLLACKWAFFLPSFKSICNAIWTLHDSDPPAFTLTFHPRHWLRTPTWTLLNLHGFMQSMNDKSCCPINPTLSCPEWHTGCTHNGVCDPHTWGQLDEETVRKAIDIFFLSFSDSPLDLEEAINQLLFNNDFTLPETSSVLVQLTSRFSSRVFWENV